jgi:phosphate transport system permease protein
MKKFKEMAMHVIFLLAACVSIFAIAVICFFMFANGFPAMGRIGVLRFLLGSEWKPGNDIYGIFPMILGSVYVTAGALAVGVPIGLFTAVFMARLCPKKIYAVLKPATDLLAGIPSVIYGFFGLVVMVPAIADICDISNGATMLTASLLLGIMILPTIVSVCEAAIRAVPENYYTGSLALGATRERSIFKCILPAAKSGICAGIVLGIGRALGETMAVIMVCGNQARMPEGIFKGCRTLTANIVMEMGYASGLHREALIATAVVLFVFILAINLIFSVLKRKSI